MKIQKMAYFVISHISYTNWTTEKYNTSFQSLNDLITEQSNNTTINVLLILIVVLKILKILEKWYKLRKLVKGYTLQIF